MLKYVLAGASAVALASTAALADPAVDASQSAPAQAGVEATQTPKYAPEEAAPITPAEVTTREDSRKLAQHEFMLADANADGVIDEAEFTAYATSIAEANVALGAQPEDAHPTDEAFADLAKDDQKISEQELTEARTASFDEADANKDQKLDPVEQQKFAALVLTKPAEGGDR